MRRWRKAGSEAQPAKHEHINIVGLGAPAFAKHACTHHAIPKICHRNAGHIIGGGVKPRGVKHTPPFSQLAPIELFFSYMYVKRYVRKFAPTDTEQLVQKIREAIDKVDAGMIAGWFRKCGFLLPGESETQERPADPNEGQENRCLLGKDTRFEAREHVACFDKHGKLRREKKKGVRPSRCERGSTW